MEKGMQYLYTNVYVCVREKGKRKKVCVCEKEHGLPFFAFLELSSCFSLADAAVASSPMLCY